jgi:putative PIN family toxin of toxin-antitoxin system
MRCVLDTSVIVSALRSSQGASYLLLRMVAAGQLRILASAALFLEYEEVLSRPEHRLVHGLSVVQVDRLLTDLAVAVEPVEIRFQWRPQVADPNDDMVFEVAVNGRADALVTHNVRHFVHAATRFGLTVLTPGEAFRKVKNE